MSTTRADYIIVGSGITGATIARRLVDAGRDVLVLERRGHLGGNVHDYLHPSGIRIHTYGPHYFRTNAAKLWEFANKFSEFYPYKAMVRSWVDGRHEVWPVNESYLLSMVGPDWTPEHVEAPSNFEEACLAMMPRQVYDKFVRGYTQKQWGVHPASLGSELAGRFDVRKDHELFFSKHTYQGIPRHGYATFMNNLLKGVPRILDVDYLRHRESFRHRRKLIFTGPIDEFFGLEFGRLKYRAQKRVHSFDRDNATVQPVGQVNNPALDNGAFIRTLEWKHMMSPTEVNAIQGTVTTREYPFTPDDSNEYEYPFPDQPNRQLYELYRQRASALSDTLICGRLGDYRYYDMDQAMARAIMLSQQLLDEGEAMSGKLSPSRVTHKTAALAAGGGLA